MTGADFASLSRRISGECHTDQIRRAVYATDASIYQQIPCAVVFPKTIDDVVEIMNFASEHDQPLLARGGGTSLAGQTVTSGIVIDFTKYLNRILEYKPAEQLIVVEPGITRDEVNAVVFEDGLEFAPDPATSSRATIGGMVANNSSGTKSILYGKTIDHVVGIKVLLTDGSIVELNSSHNPVHDDERITTLCKIASENADLISETFPTTMRRVNGYPLDEIHSNGEWHPHKIFVGSEGTLGIILEVTLKLVELPAHKAVAVVQFDKTNDAVSAVATMLQFNPAAVEILSNDLIEYSRKNLVTRSMTEWVKGSPESVQIVEFYSDTPEDIERRAQDMFEALRSKDLGFAFDLYHEGETYNHVWSIRKKGLGLLMGEPNDQRGVAFIEDAAIPVEHLPDYIDQVLQICKSHNIDVTYYAHASVGVIHVRPILDLRSADDIMIMKKIARETFELVRSYHGAWSGEHGDGRVRSPFLRDFFGDEMYSLLKEVKELFDPAGILNPGVIIDPPPMDTHLRYGPDYQDSTFESEYQYRDQHNFHTAVHQCTGIGSCRKIQGGTMCPSYMVTKDDLHSTRGRANALRLAMSGQLNQQDLADPALLSALDLCLSCKACKAECPSSVDMARLKSEVLQIQYDTHGPSLRDRLIGKSSDMARRLSGTPANLVNSLQKAPVFRKGIEAVASISADRILPSYASQSFSSWFRKNYEDQGHPQRVALFADTYLNYHEPKIGIKAVEIIQMLGYDVDLLEGCCQRPRISHGFLKDARKHSRALVEAIIQYDVPVLVVEPGCASALTDDLPDLIADDEKSAQLKTRPIPIGIWLADIAESNQGVLTCKSRKILLHGHCHQKALYGTGHIHRLLNIAGAEIYEPDSGCCGMGGSFGYESEHYDISQALANRVLVPAITDRPDHTVVASGFSCRHQIEHFAHVEVRHWLEELVVVPGH